MHGLAGLIPILAHFLMKVFKVFPYFSRLLRLGLGGRVRRLGLGG